MLVWSVAVPPRGPPGGVDGVPTSGLRERDEVDALGVSGVGWDVEPEVFLDRLPAEKREGVRDGEVEFYAVCHELRVVGARTRTGKDRHGRPTA